MGARLEHVLASSGRDTKSPQVNNPLTPPNNPLTPPPPREYALKFKINKQQNFQPTFHCYFFELVVVVFAAGCG